MTRLPVLTTLVVTGVPLLGDIRWPVVTLAIGATVLLLTGIQRRSLRATVVGALLAISELTLALISIQAGLILLQPAAVGLALVYLVEEVGFAGRVATAHVDTAARQVMSHARLQQAVTAIAITVLVAALASGAAAYLPAYGSVRIMVGGIGAIVALLAALAGASGFRLKRRRTAQPDTT